MFSTQRNDQKCDYSQSEQKKAENHTYKWNINAQNLKDSSTIFPIERTHVVLENISASIVANRVALFLEKKSIFATFNDNEAMAVAETEDHTTFEIRLLKHQTEDKKENLLLEVQRISGCSISFHWSAKAILKSAQGIVVKATVPPRPPDVSLISPSLPEDKYKEQIAVAEEIENIKSLLQKDRLDANILGMESLRFLTSLHFASAKNAENVSSLFFHNKEGKSTIGDKVKSIVQSGYLDSNYECEIERSFVRIIYHHALAVIANSLEIILVTGDIQLVESDTWLTEEILPLLFREIECAKRPHDVFEAVKFLNALLRASINCRANADKIGALSTVLGMVKSGACTHQRIRKEIEKSRATLLMTV